MIMDSLSQVDVVHRTSDFYLLSEAQKAARVALAHDDDDGE